jgi:hypothetical protein
VTADRQVTLVFQHDTSTLRRIQLAVLSNTGAIAFADSQNYLLIVPPAVQSIPLFPFHQPISTPTTNNSVTRASYTPTTQPLICAVGDDEFLLAMPPAETSSRSIGIFVNANGEPVRGTLEWPSYPTDIYFASPYLISFHADRQQLAIYSLLDLCLKQTISVETGAGRLFCTCGYRDFQYQPPSPLSPALTVQHSSATETVMSQIMFVNGQQSVYALQMLSTAEQIMEMIKRDRLEDALDLVKNAKASGEGIDHLQSAIGWIGWAQLMKGIIVYFT